MDRVDDMDGMDARPAKPSIEDWLDAATEGLGPSGRERVRAELLDHFAEDVEERVAGGAAEEDAVATALEEFGDPEKARVQLRRFYLTERQEKLVRDRLDTARMYQPVSWEPAPPLPWSMRLFAGILIGWPFVFGLGLLFHFAGALVFACALLGIAVTIGVGVVVFRLGRAASKKAAADYREAATKHDAARIFGWQVFGLPGFFLMYALFAFMPGDEPRAFEGLDGLVIVSEALGALVCGSFAVYYLCSQLSIWRKLRRLPPPVLEMLFQRQARRRRL